MKSLPIGCEGGIHELGGIRLVHTHKLTQDAMVRGARRFLQVGMLLRPAFGSNRASREKARAIQRERFQKKKGIHANVAMIPRLIRKHCELDAEGAGFLEHAMTNMNFSARDHDRTLKVARTLADLDGMEKVQTNHALEATNYETLDPAMWS